MIPEYDYNVILESANLYNSSIEKQKYLIEQLEKGKEYFEINKDRQEKYAVDQFIINGEILDLTKNRPPAPKHREHYKYHFETFVEKLSEEIDNLNDFVEYENAINECEAELTIQGKYFAYSKLKTIYIDSLNFYKIEKEPNPIVIESIQNIENQLNIINNRLITLKEDFNSNQSIIGREIPKKNKLKPLSLKPYFDDLYWATETINNNSKGIFISTLEQWKNLFSDDIQIFDVPIELNNGITLKHLVYFLDELHKKRVIKNSKYNKLLEDVKAFSYNGKVISAQQYADAKKGLNNNFPDDLEKINKIFEILKID